MAEVMCKDSDDALEYHEKTKDEALKYEEEYKEYCRDVGVQHSTYTPRVLGEEISLMTEIVFK